MVNKFEHGYGMMIFILPSQWIGAIKAMSVPFALIVKETNFSRGINREFA
jgi:hypothetical protein